MYLLTTFARKLGSKDKQKRKSKLIKNIALGSVGALITGMYLKKRGLKDLNTIKQKITKYKNKVTKNSSGNEGLDLAFKFKQEVLKRKSKQKINKKVKNYNAKRLLSNPNVASTAILGGTLLALPFVGRLAKGRSKPKKEKK